MLLLDDLRARVAAHPDRVALVLGARRLTYREVLARAEAWEPPEGPGPRVLLPAGEDIFMEVFGAWMRGRIPVVVPRNLPAPAMERVRHIAALPPPVLPGGPE